MQAARSVHRQSNAAAANAAVLTYLVYLGTRSEKGGEWLKSQIEAVNVVIKGHNATEATLKARVTEYKTNGMAMFPPAKTAEEAAIYAADAVQLAELAKLTDKAFHAYSLGKERNRDGLEIARIARGISAEQMDREPSLFSVINSSSPLRLDTPMLQGIIEMSARNQIIILTPFTLAGAMAPVTIAGALAQQNAEALAGIAFTQLVRPGAPVVYGGFTSNVDMKTGAPAFGTPEYMKAVLAGGQLCRKYGIPYRTSNVCAANTVDAQAAYEIFNRGGALSDPQAAAGE
jgi:trimethylamine:corrinoid methyltransferase-like protein